ncbi:MAG: FAD-binding oxidoreductase [Gemmatimonadetes bacterium]|nr:FAD-binding oxidoreductase [Gemmatimonadota bacterium]
MSANAMLERLAQAAGAGSVVDGSTTPFRFAGVPPRAVIAPHSVERAAAVLELCSVEGWATLCAGGGTWLAAARRPRGIAVVLMTRRLVGETLHVPADLTASVAAGTPLRALPSTLRAAGQYWPVDAPADRDATTGGVAAMASAGPDRFSAGTPRDHVLGLELITGDGRVLRFGGRVVKNVAGYDMVRLMIGSSGTLGLITRLELRLRPVPEREVTAVWGAAEPDALVEIAARAIDTWPAAVELISPPVAHAALGALHWALLVRCAGNTEFVSDARTRLESLWPDRGRILDHAEATNAWARLRTAETETSVLIRLAGMPASLGATLRAALDITGDDAGRWRLACHAGNGIVRVWRSDDIDADRAQRLALAIENVRAETSESRIRVRVPVVPETMPVGFAPVVIAGAEHRLTNGIRRVFDPAGILSPEDGSV